jgi:glycogen synthase
MVLEINLLALIDALGLHDRVDLRPAAYADMPSLYAESDVVVYPTVGEEPYGLVPLEAMSCGSPVVVARSGGLSETVLAVHGKNCTWDISSI